jgi:hypothetical protein
MDLNLDRPFIVKTKKLKDVVFILNTYIEDELKKTDYYEEDKEYFTFTNLKLKISSTLKTKKMNLKYLCLFAPKLIILKSSGKINNYSFEKDDWMIIPFDIRDEYESENIIYAFALS